MSNSKSDPLFYFLATIVIFVIFVAFVASKNTNSEGNQVQVKVENFKRSCLKDNCVLEIRIKGKYKKQSIAKNKLFFCFSLGKIALDTNQKPNHSKAINKIPKRNYLRPIIKRVILKILAGLTLPEFISNRSKASTYSSI